MLRLFVISTILLTSGHWIVCPASADEASDLKAVSNVGPEGAGHDQAIAAAGRLSKLAPTSVLSVLDAMDDATPLGKNWLRGIAEDVADNGKLPLDALHGFVKDRSGSRDGRYTGFMLIRDQAPEVAAALLKNMRDDPSLKLRYVAIDEVLQRAKAADQEEATSLYREALATALHPSQLTTIAKALREVGDQVNLASHMGFLTDWQLIASFDNTAVRGYGAVFGPEQDYLKDPANAPAGSYQGKHGKVSWQEFQSEDELGLVNLNPVYENEKSAVCYAYTSIQSSVAGPAQVRLGCINANKIWVNGELVTTNEVYHARSGVDQYVDSFSLKKGRNTILIKVCQNAQEESWAQRWEFQLRITDPDAKPIHFE